MPDDHAQAMTAICYVLHHRNDEIPDALDTNLLLEVAMLADKYAFAQALKYAFRNWIQVYLSLASTDPSTLLAASFYFGDARTYEAVSQMLVINHVGEIRCNNGDLPQALQHGLSSYS